MNKVVPPTAILLLSVSSITFAVRPTGIDFDGYANTEEGEKYARFVVECSNGRSQAITAWDNRRNWCIGEESRESCHSKQLKAARAACNIK
jgi:hypothetical protein